MSSEILDLLIVAAASGAIGGLEITERFTDEPLKALLTPPAAAYVAVNVVAGIVALLLIRLINVEFGFTDDPEVERWAQVIVAGLGAVVLLRSVVFVSANDGGQYGVGGVIERLLAQTETLISRRRGPARALAVKAAVEGLTYDEARTSLGAIANALLPNARETARQELATTQTIIDESGELDKVKLWMLCSAILNFGGEETLRKAAEQLRETIATTSPAP